LALVCLVNHDADDPAARGVASASAERIKPTPPDHFFVR
jgi:hypothetical protein